ncbi:MAG TPA: hypothetical protein VM286_08620 [Candidatus Thermoplasmatota archaeon]|nr:hypothetical protein [Candidatus Thermoplasmatota archaeon]
MATLEIQTGKVPGTVIRRSPAERPAIVGAMILGLFLCQLLFMALLGMALYQDAISDGKKIPDANNAATHHPAIDHAPLGTLFKNEQTIISFWIACIFFCMAYMVFLYQRFFKDHVTIAKRRFRKWEDEGVQLHD